MAEQWIVVRNWDKHQHYSPAVRTPPWIKAYTAELLHSDDYLELPLATRGVLHGLWAHYALARGVVPASTQQLSSVLGATVYRHQLERLNQAGFIQFSASKPPTTDASTTRARKRREEKKKQEPSVSVPSPREDSAARDGTEQNTEQPNPNGTHNPQTKAPHRHLDELLKQANLPTIDEGIRHER